MDNVDHTLFKDSAKGIRVDGYSWNELERTLCLIIVHLSSDASELDKLNQTEINAIAQRPRRFVETSREQRFMDRLDPSTGGYVLASFINSIDEEIVKFRFVVITDYVLSDRVKFISVDNLENRSAQGSLGLLRVFKH